VFNQSSSVRPNLADCLPQTNGTENQSITSKRVLIRRKEGPRAQKGYLYKMPVLLSTFRKFSTSLCGKQSARLELPARLVPGLPTKEIYFA
jgi:hypothetical protein